MSFSFQLHFPSTEADLLRLSLGSLTISVPISATEATSEG